MINLAPVPEYQDALKFGAKQVRLDTKRLESKRQQELEKLLTQWASSA
ncbi:MAG: hypothetical protein JW732_02745 [Dehalococcoidia bacterium]|nr:hypothetical protein [Dehalococcoidia bacterium]